MLLRFIPALLFGFLSHSANISATVKDFTFIEMTNEFSDSESLFNSLSSNSFSLPTKESFTKAFEGYIQLSEKGLFEKDLLTVVDFSMSANEKRLWIIDLSKKEVIHQTYVSHGRNSGDEFAKKFSNIPESFQSSLGFYATAEPYFGKHGYSLRLDGLEQGINDKARERAIVIHGADYVSENFISKHGRLGRSLGCPALAKEESKMIIDLIKEKSCLFIYYPSQDYLTKSQLVS
jgi:hypothetical protein